MANPIGAVTFDYSPWSELDTHLFKEGNHFSVDRRLGAQPLEVKGKQGTYFSVWAPNAAEVCVVGNFNEWAAGKHTLGLRPDGTGVWEGFIPGVGKGSLYKFWIRSQHNGHIAEKSDPFALYTECPPKSASVVWDLEYAWNDREWMQFRYERQHQNAPISIYEVHLGSWKKVAEDGNRSLSYREIAPALAAYVKQLGYTHVELMPIMEHPFYGSWGYQITGYFAPTSRFGTPQDFMAFVDIMHQNDIGVILDWVPSHFASDGHGLAYFDGTHLFEHEDMRQGYHPDWGSYIFNYGRNEIRNFLISNALYWLRHYHIDGLRVDAVASMLYLDYSRKAGEWIPNKEGGRENLGAIDFIKRCNEMVYSEFPDVQMIAEESTSWPNVSRPLYDGGLGFGFKWNMGWMNDTIRYFLKDPLYRKYHHDNLTFSMCYAFSEHFILSISHDEVVHGKGSLLSKMPGNNDFEKFANMRLFTGYQFLHPGKKLMFMGSEFAQGKEWNHDHSLDWHQLENGYHRSQSTWVSHLNHLYRNEKALHENEADPACFYWIDCKDWENSIISFARQTPGGESTLIAIFNFTPVTRSDYRIGLPRGGFWKEVLNSDATEYSGSGCGNWGGHEAEETSWQKQPYSMKVNLPPLGMVVFKNG
ncbi:MAG: 1,4-alpha-glucan branching protein GlgB [Verrucomicrobiota bacterium]